MKKMGIALIRGYQFLVSPLFPPCCRFYPTCSEYCLTAVQKHGFFKGVIKGVVRLSKCHPLHPGGYDPVE